MEDNYEQTNNQDANATQTETGTTSDTYPGFKDAKPEDVKHKVKETVQKGVAAVAGALKGFTEEAQKHKLADTTKEAISKAGETTRQVVGTTAQEYQKTKDHVKQSVQGTGASSASVSGTGTLGSASASDVGALGGSSSSMGASNVRGTSMRENAMQDVADEAPANRAGNVGVPDLRNTKLGETDEDLEQE